MKFQHRTQVQAPIEKVASFHLSARSLKAITPPFFFMSAIRAPDPLADGDEIGFTLWLGLLPVRWHARIENPTQAGFDDVLIQGPFQAWRHSHRFQSMDSGTTQIEDLIEYQLQRHWFWGPVGLLMAIGLPGLFGYRAWRTRTMIEKA
jgi:ligand-binding SRPBCC domain-containing protein